MTLFATPQWAAPRLRTVQAILVHEDDTNPNGSSDCALTTHNIEHTAKGLRIGAGRIFGASDQQALLDILRGALSHDGGFLPPEVVSCGRDRLAWVVPGGVRRMWFRFDGQTVRLKVPWPTLLIEARQGRMRVVALKGQQRPQPDAPVFHAPLMNLHGNTHLCTGSAILPAGVSLAERAAFETALFETNFTHINHPNTLRLREADEAVSNARHLKFWRDLEAEALRTFPAHALVPLKQSVSQWLTESKG